MNVAGDQSDIAGDFEALGGDVTLADLFSDDWMRAHTDIGTIDELFAESDFAIRSQADFEAIPTEQWDAYIAAHTEFPDWQTMLAAALEDFERS